MAYTTYSTEISTFWWEYLDTLFPAKHRKRNKHKEQQKEEIINKVCTYSDHNTANLSLAKRWNTGCQGFKFSQLRDLKYGTLGTLKMRRFTRFLLHNEYVFGNTDNIYKQELVAINTFDFLNVHRDGIGLQMSQKHNYIPECEKLTQSMISFILTVSGLRNQSQKLERTVIKHIDYLFYLSPLRLTHVGSLAEVSEQSPALSARHLKFNKETKNELMIASPTRLHKFLQTIRFNNLLLKELYLPWSSQGMFLSSVVIQIDDDRLKSNLLVQTIFSLLPLPASQMKLLMVGIGFFDQVQGTDKIAAEVKGVPACSKDLCESKLKCKSLSLALVWLTNSFDFSFFIRNCVSLPCEKKLASHMSSVHSFNCKLWPKTDEKDSSITFVEKELSTRLTMNCVF
ncbi:hypothetical protein NC652_003786 [Populus alba x Populus x berolinensis]|nr:hypothetical protein NC652_003786 [Populus alba x Populus x berolinensis]